jgi:hypothetical protein
MPAHQAKALLLQTSVMTRILTASIIAAAVFLGLPNIALGSGQVCGRLGDHDVLVPDEYAYSHAEYQEGTGFVTCDSEIDVLEIRSRLENVEQASMAPEPARRGDDYLITLQPKSSEPKPLVRDVLASLYDAKNYSLGSKPPLPKIKDGNGLYYMRGSAGIDGARRTDIYLKSTSAGYVEFMIYCDVSRTKSDERGCMMGYSENELDLNVVIKIGQSEVGSYRAIMQEAKATIKPIFIRNVRD